jgi:hypothetical protein
MKKEERRAGGRAKAVLPIGVRVGRRKLTAGCTLDAGPSGALILCTENVPLGTELHVTNLKSDEWFTCRVVRNAGKHESGRYALGVENVEKGVKTPSEPASPPVAPRRGGGRRSS